MLNIIVEQITSLGDGVLMIGSLAYILGVRKGKSKYLVLFMLLQYLCAQYLIQLPVRQTNLYTAIITRTGQTASSRLAGDKMAVICPLICQTQGRAQRCQRTVRQMQTEYLTCWQKSYHSVHPARS